MKRYFLAVLIGLMTIVMSSCGNATPDELSDVFIKRDVEDYIVEVMDEDAKLKIFEKVSSDISGNEMIVVCNAFFIVDDIQQQGEFTLTYEVENKAWILSKCKVNLSEEGNGSEVSSQDKDAASVTTEEPKPSVKPTAEPTSEPTVELSDELFDYTLKLDGVVYKLPCSFQLFKDNGWVISSRGVTENDMIVANGHQYFNVIKNGSEVTFYAINMSGNAKSIKDCKIGRIDVYRNDLVDVGMFSIAKGINLDSTVDAITTAFGAANTTNKYDSYVNSAYSQNSNCSVDFSTYTDGTTKYNSISIRNYVSDESDVTETSTEVPEYLATYVVPTELGNDIMSGNIEVEGDVYCLPAPVSAFIDNGWSITQQSGGIGSGNTDSIRLERNGKRLYLFIINYSFYQTTPENCAVYRISVNDNEKISLKLPGDISFNSTKADVEKYVSDEFSYYKGSSSYNYSYNNYNIGFSLSINVNDETEKVSYISLSCENWDY